MKTIDRINKEWEKKIEDRIEELKKIAEERIEECVELKKTIKLLNYDLGQYRRILNQVVEENKKLVKGANTYLESLKQQQKYLRKTLIEEIDDNITKIILKAEQHFKGFGDTHNWNCVLSTIVNPIKFYFEQLKKEEVGLFRENERPFKG